MPYSLPRLKYFFFLKNNFIYLFLAVLGFGVAVSWDYSLAVVFGPLTVGLLSQSTGSRAPWLQYLQLSGSTAQAQQLWHMGLSCSLACGIFSDQGSNLRLLPWRADSLLLSHQGEKAMAPHSSTLAWKIPWTEEPGGLQSMGSGRVRHD